MIKPLRVLGMLGRFLVVEGGMNDIALWNTEFQRYLKITSSGSISEKGTMEHCQGPDLRAPLMEHGTTWNNSATEAHETQHRHADEGCIVMGCGLANVRKFSWRLVWYSGRIREASGCFT